MIFEMRKLFVLSGMAAALFFSPLVTNAEKTEGILPEEFVGKYVELGKAKDYENIVDLVVDERFNNDRQTKVDMYKMFQEDLPSVEDYEIKEVKNVTEDQATVVTILEYDDGSIEQTPMHLVKKDGSWKLHLSNENANGDEDFEQIKQADVDVVQQEAVNNYSAMLAASGPLTMSFNYWGRAGGSTFYSNATFDTKVKNSFALVATQTHSFASSETVRVTYSIVQPGGFFTNDKVWGSAYKTGSYPTKAFEGSIPRSSSAPRYANAKLKFETMMGSTSGMGYQGEGSLYEY